MQNLAKLFFTTKNRLYAFRADEIVCGYGALMTFHRGFLKSRPQTLLLPHVPCLRPPLDHTIVMGCLAGRTNGGTTAKCCGLCFVCLM